MQLTRLCFGITLWTAALVASSAQAQEEDTCGAAGFAGLLGQSGAIADMLNLDQPTRIILPGDLVTTDLQVARINFEIDANFAIARIWCG